MCRCTVHPLCPSPWLPVYELRRCDRCPLVCVCECVLHVCVCAQAAAVALMDANLKRAQKNFGSSADNMTAVVAYLLPRA